jgi:NAD(P)H-dependent FMN reductase
MTKQDFKLAIIIGTNRTNRQSMHVAKLIEKEAKKFAGFHPQLVDLLKFKFSKNDQEPTLSDPAYKTIIEEADALLIVLPEYNHGYPAVLKRALDSEYGIYLHKPVAIAGVSNGPWGGVRAVELILPILRTFGMLISKVDLNFPYVEKLFNKNGNLLDEAYLSRIDKSLTELLWLTQISHWGKQNLS